MNQTTKEFRKNLADKFIKALSEKKLEWKQGWLVSGQEPVNAVTGKPYKGINRFLLAMANAEAMDAGLSGDNRWATFHQVQQKGWKLKKGCHGHKVEYWEPHDFEQKKRITWEEYAKKADSPEKCNIGIIAKYYTVFNGRDIEGIPELLHDPVEKRVINEELITKISNGMGVAIEHDGRGRAYYKYIDDSIHLPQKEFFLSEYEYHATALHELAHATGAGHRLNRNMGGGFGTPSYAYEELVAEISSSFMGEHLHIEQTEEHIQNHAAYVQSWIEQIKKTPDILTRAIRDADNAANFLEYHAGILTKEEYYKSQGEDREIPAEQVKDPGRQGSLENASGLRKRDLLKNGFKPTAQLLKKMEKLDALTGKENTVRDIHTALQSDSLNKNSDIQKTVQSIGKMLKNQELARLQQAPVR